MAEMATILRADLPFRRFVSGLALVSFGTMSTGFLMAYAVLSLGASDEIAAWYTVMLLAASVLANSALGWLADRHGFSAVGQAAALAGAGLSILAMLANQPLWLLASFAFVGIGQAGSQLAVETGPMEFAPVDRRPSYVALCFGLVSLAGAVAPLVGGVLVSQLGYHALFAASALFSISGGVALHAHRPPLIRGA